jgi:menaquinone-9 beta-reductase
MLAATSNLQRETSNIFEIGIAGGGLAGLSLAISLAQRGHKVVLFEKNTYPNHKVCGEYLSKESHDFLLRLGIPLQEIKIPHINQVEITSPNGNKISRPLQMGGIGISRYSLEALMATTAIEAGVKMYTSTKVENIDYQNDVFTFSTTSGNFTTQVAAGSFGKTSNLNSTQKPTRNYVGVKYHIKGHFNENVIGLHNFEGGYCGASKIEDDKFCLCYLVDAESLRKAGSIQKLEKTVLSQNPFLNDIWNTAEFLFQEPLTISNITFSYKAAVTNHILYLGDAAGTIAPLTGNGMSMALRASHLANPLISDYLQQKITRQQLEKKYTDIWLKQFGMRVQISKNLQNLFGKKHLTNLTIGALKYFPGLTDILIRLTHGEKF